MKKQDLFRKYKGPATEFVETGTYTGDGIRAALKAEFDIVHSFEITGHGILAANRFKTNSNVHIYPRSSKGDTFRTVLANLSGPSLIWLDAYPSRVLTPELKDDPLKKELSALAAASHHPHTVIISRGETLTESEVREELQRKYRNHSISYEELDDADQKVMCIYN